MGQDHRSDRFVPVAFQSGPEVLRVEGLSPVRLNDVYLKAVSARQLDPALAKLAVVATDHPISTTKCVDDSGFHGSCTATGDHQHIVVGLMQPAQLSCCSFHHRLKLAAAVPDGMASHRFQNRFWHRGGSGDHQGELVLHVRKSANRSF